MNTSRFGRFAILLMAAVALVGSPWRANAAEATQALTTDLASSPTQPWELLAPLKVVRLENGMTFLLYPNRRAPIFTGLLRFDVGGKDETAGQTGISHMFEHMAFKGTRNLGTRDWEAERDALAQVETAAHAYDAKRNLLERAGVQSPALEQQLAPERDAVEAAKAAAGRYVVKDEYDQIYDREGANGLNATTSSDATTYFVSLPANRLELWARMESDRITSPVMREFYSERDVVMEERRMRKDSSPIGQLWELTMATAFVAHPYGYPVIGFEDDIENLTATAAIDFFKTHYTPDRAVGVIVGDIDLKATERLLRTTFGSIPARPEMAGTEHILREPPQRGERRAILRFAATPTLFLAWHKPAGADPDSVTAEVLMQVLAGGRSARWFEKFVKTDRLAADISAFSGPGDAEPNLFMVYATPQGHATLAELEQGIKAESARLAHEPVTAEELARAKKTLRANTIRSLETNFGLAQALADLTQLSGDPYYLERRLRLLDAIMPEDLMAFAGKYLVDDNLTVGLLEPPVAEGESADAAASDAATTATQRSNP